MNQFFYKDILKQRAELERETAEALSNLTVPADICLMENIRYGADARHVMDVFLPGGDGNHPVLVNIHGGGMVMGTKEQNRRFCIRMAQQGFLVFAPEYRLVPETDCFGQLEDIRQALDEVLRRIPELGGDRDYVYGIGDSAGAWLLLYTCAIGTDPEMAQTMGVSPSALRFRALGFQNGMFYSTRMDKIGLISGSFFGKGFRRKPFAKYLNPAALSGLPPMYLLSGTGDFLKGYTLRYAKVLQKKKACAKLCFYEDDTMAHADTALHPDRPNCRAANEAMLEFFRTI